MVNRWRLCRFRFLKIEIFYHRGTADTEIYCDGISASESGGFVCDGGESRMEGIAIFKRFAAICGHIIIVCGRVLAGFSGIGADLE